MSGGVQGVVETSPPEAWTGSYGVEGDTLVVQDVGDPPFEEARLLRWLDALAAEHGSSVIRMPADEAKRAGMDARAWRADADAFEIEIPAFLQLRRAWLDRRLWPITPEHRCSFDGPGGWHPRRPRVPDGCLYRKRLAATGETFALHRATTEEHGDLFHRWQNTAYVAEAWDEQGTREEHDAFLRERRRDRHIEPLVGTLDGTAFAYLELYWAREDRIGPHCQPGPYDQGLHLLVGEPAYLGGERTAAWMRALFHFAFLREPRTQRLVGEPDAGNERVLRRLEQTGWREEHEFDFPHKRARLVTLDRQRFFQEERP